MEIIISMKKVKFQPLQIIILLILGLYIIYSLFNIRIADYNGEGSMPTYNAFTITDYKNTSTFEQKKNTIFFNNIKGFKIFDNIPDINIKQSNVWTDNHPFPATFYIVDKIEIDGIVIDTINDKSSEAFEKLDKAMNLVIDKQIKEYYIKMTILIIIWLCLFIFYIIQYFKVRKFNSNLLKNYRY